MKDKHIGEEINNWLILSRVNNTSYGCPLYYCVCKRCGTESLKSYSQMARNKSGKCKSCKPNYSFIIDGNIAKGVLEDGTPFLIDSNLIDEVSKYYWRVDSKGYIKRGDTNLPKMMLHWFVMGLEAKHKYQVDHINQNKMDNRKENLRMVTCHQNNMNHGITKANKSGYVGVFWYKKNKRWLSKISLNNHNIYLGYTDDLIEGAQMYNVASKFLFGRFAGHTNDVPTPSFELVSDVLDKCKPYLYAAQIAQRAVETAA